ncbi:MAG: hypothetical protein FWF05_06500 [Oscillospiraceae bacterium]|nr:hypothetical protein [Oscillospiraceae bacterium]
MKRKRGSLADVFSNNKILLIFSVLLAAVIWGLIAIFFSPVEERVITGVPVVIDLKNSVPAKFGLQVFGQREFTISITVSGQRYLISPAALKADDFIVTADASRVDAAGKSDLRLDIRTKNRNADFEIVAYSESSISVYFDYLLEQEYAVEPEVSSELESIVGEGYIRGETIVSRELVTVSGPATEVEKITRVIAKVKVEETLLKTTAFESTVIPLNEYNGTLRYLTVNGGEDAVTVTVPVLKTAELRSNLLFKGTPSYFALNPIAVECVPETLNVAMAEDLLDDSGTLNVLALDFSDINTGRNSFTVDSREIPNAIVLDEIEEITLTFTIPEEFRRRTVGLPMQNVSFTNAREGAVLSVLRSGDLTVTVIGLEDDLAELTGENLYATVDASLLEDTDETQTAVASVFVRDKYSVWVYGSYELPVKIIAG